MNERTDPRVFYAAERTLLAWNRTCIATMGFGFVIERFGLFLRLLAPAHAAASHLEVSYWVGLSLIVFAVALAILSTLSFRAAIATLGPADRPSTPFASLAVIANLGIATVGIGLIGYLAFAAR
jgi:putative membrane protein